MLEVRIPLQEVFDEEECRFIVVDEKVYKFEHSLLTISEWEAKYRRPFMTPNNQMNEEETIDYILMMSLDAISAHDLTQDIVTEVLNYINEKPTATTINSSETGGSNRIMTSEVIYAYMANAQVPFTCETWNIHRLMTLLGVIGEFNKPAKKMKQEDVMARQAALNAARKAKMNTSG